MEISTPPLVFSDVHDYCSELFEIFSLQERLYADYDRETVIYIATNDVASTFAVKADLGYILGKVKDIYFAEEGVKVFKVSDVGTHLSLVVSAAVDDDITQALASWFETVNSDHLKIIK